MSAQDNYKELFIQLADLIKAGDTNSRQADDLRDQLDDYWRELDEDERAEMRSFCARCLE